MAVSQGKHGGNNTQRKLKKHQRIHVQRFKSFTDSLQRGGTVNVTVTKHTLLKEAEETRVKTG